MDSVKTGLDRTLLKPDSPVQPSPEKGMGWLDELSTAVAYLTPEGKILNCNRAVNTLAAHPQQDLCGQLLAKALPFAASEAHLQIRSALARAMAGEQATIDLPLLSDRKGGAPAIFRFSFRTSSRPAESATILVEARDVTAETLRLRESARMLASAEHERNRLRDLLSQTPAGIGLTSGSDHRWTFINEDFVRITGRLTAADFLGKTVREAMPEMEAQGFPAILDQVYKTGEPYFGREVRAIVNRKARGLPEEGYFDFLYQAMHNSDGIVEGIFIYAIEVTSMVAARKAVEENVERLRLAQSAAQIGVWEWDPIHDIHRLSPELHHIFGTEPSDADFVSQWGANVHREDWNRVQAFMIEGHRVGSMEFEYRYCHPEHGLRWLYCKGHRRPSETRMFGVVQDITSRKTAEVAAQRLAAIVESSDDAIVSKDLNGIVTSWNPGAERTFGFTADEMIGQPITKIIPPEFYDDETRILSTIALGDRIEHFETVRLRKDGQRIDVSLTVSPVRDKTGRIVGAAKIARNITQQKKAEQALRTSERLASVGRLAATVAHEINNPLEAVTNLVYLARNSEDPDKYLAMAEEELGRVSLLTRQTLGFYRETKSATRIRVSELIDGLLAVFAARIRNKTLQVSCKVKKEVEVTAVPGEIRQIIANLISNSIDAVGAGGCIRLRISGSMQRKPEPVRGVRITIADDGSGIPREIRKHLFEPFFTTKKEVGTGLGLWICKRIVENHQGSIEFRSWTDPGKSGTIFSVFLAADANPSIDAGTSAGIRETV